MSWAELIETKCPRCDSLACTNTEYGFSLEIGNQTIDFSTFFCRQCGLKFDVKDDMLR